MWTRRRLLQLTALAPAWPLATRAATAAPRRHNIIYGCTLPHAEAHAFFGRATESRLYVTGEEAMIPGSDDREFDYALAQTLAKISVAFDVAPGFAYFDDSDSHNAYATRVVRSNGVDGTVLFGQQLLKQLMAGSDHPDLAVACVCAHEFGHILQYKRNLDDKARAGQPTVKRVELQADFFAGYFAGLRKRERPGFPAAVFAATQYEMGDDRIHNPQHHGTRDERAAAIVRGFDVAYREKRALGDAIAASFEHVRAL
jgi:uncharacterized protein DUF955